MLPDDIAPPGEAGFALIEVLAAVAIAGITLSAAAVVVAATQSAIRSASERASLTVAARSLLEGMPWTEGLRAGTTTGVLDGTRWRIDVAPAPRFATPGRSFPWTPASIAVSLRSASGRSLRVETVGLLEPVAPTGQAP